MSTPLSFIAGIGPATAQTLADNGFADAESVAASSTAALGAVPGFGPVRAKQTIAAAKKTIAMIAPSKKSKRNAKKAPAKKKKAKPDPNAASKAKPDKKKKKKKSDKKGKKSKKKKSKKKKGKKK